MQNTSHVKIAVWFILFLSIMMAIAACKSPENTSAQHQTTLSKPDLAADKPALLPGTYTGIVPCEGCEGIVTTLIVSSDKTYQLTRQFLKGDEGTTEEQSGPYTLSTDGRSIELKCSKNESTVYYIMKDQLVQAGPDGTMRADPKYVLQKEVTNRPDQELLTGKWKLIELMGKPVTEPETPRQQIHITFVFADMRVSGSAGCNQYFGTFEMPGNGRIRFSKIGATMMACPEPAMAAEQEFLQMLEMVDNYAATEKTLSLHKARMAPIARFEKAE